MGINVTGLAENHTDSVEPHGKRLQVMAYLAGVEKVLSPETRKWPEKITLSHDNHLLKGRLQSAKTADGVNVAVKSNQLGDLVVKTNRHIYAKRLN